MKCFFKFKKLIIILKKPLAMFSKKIKNTLIDDYFKTTF